MDIEHPEPPSFWRSSAGLTLLVAIAVGGFYLVTEHTAHLFGVLAYLFILACPLMHMFMHHGHGHGGHGHQHGQPRSPDRTGSCATRSTSVSSPSCSASCCNGPRC
jgi:hypothetical protein